MYLIARPLGSVRLRAALPKGDWLVASDASRQWVHLTVDGNYAGHPAGEFEFNDSVHKQIIANFERQRNPVPVTLEHVPDGQPAPDFGWIHSFEIRGEGGKRGLWGLVEFTKDAAALIKDGKYKFTSVEVDFEATDRVTGDAIGAEVSRVAMTNLPFIDGQQPVSLSRKAGKRRLSMDPNEVLAQVRTLLGLGDDADVETISQAVGGIGTHAAAITAKPKAKTEGASEGALSDDAETVDLADETPAPAVELQEAPAEDPLAGEMEAIVSTLAEALGADAAAVLAAMREKLEDIAAMLAGGASSGDEAEAQAQAGMSAEGDTVALSAAKARMAALGRAIKDKDAKIGNLADRIAELESAADGTRIDEAIKAGHILEADRPKFVKLARTDHALFEEWLGDAATTPAVPVGTLVAGKGGPRKTALSQGDADRTSPAYQKYDRNLRHVISDADKRHEKIMERLAVTKGGTA